MTQYIIYDFISLERYFKDDISNLENNSNIFIINTDNIISHPIGCNIVFEKDNKYLNYNSKLSNSEKDTCIKFIRDKRDELLKASDYLMIDDVQFDYKVELKEYRQYLRDLLNNINNDLLNYYNISNKKLYLIDKFQYYDFDKLKK